MGHSPDDDCDADVQGLTDCGQGESELAAIDREALLDHHVEELQAVLDELARRTG